MTQRQSSLFNESTEALEHGLYRSAHVLSWAGFIDYLEQKIASDGLVLLKKVKPELNKYSSIEEIAEHVAEYYLIEYAYQMKLLTKKEKGVLHGLLSKRNECAHPGDYQPDMNETLGYISELLNRIEVLEKKKLV